MSVVCKPGATIFMFLPDWYEVMEGQKNLYNRRYAAMREGGGVIGSIIQLLVRISDQSRFFAGFVDCGL